MNRIGVEFNEINLKSRKDDFIYIKRKTNLVKSGSKPDPIDKTTMNKVRCIRGYE